MAYVEELTDLATNLLADKSAMIKFSLNKLAQQEIIQETQFLNDLFPTKNIPLRVRCLVISQNITNLNYPICPICNNPVGWNLEYQSDFNQFCSQSCRLTNKQAKQNPKLLDKEWLYLQKITLNRSYEDIGKELGLSPTPVASACERFKITIKNTVSQKPNLSKEKLLECLLDKTKTIEEIAESLNTSRHLLHQLARETEILSPNQSFTEFRFNCKSTLSTPQQKEKSRITCLEKYCFPYVPLSHMTRTSKVELQVKEFVRNLLDDDTIDKSRQILLPEMNGEVDIWIPQCNLALEVNGVYWHSQKHSNDKNRHFDKFNILRQKGIQLLQFWDTEIKQKEAIVYSLIGVKCRAANKIIPGRKTRLVELPFAVANTFHSDHHLQGSITRTQGIYNLGLAYQDELIAVISIGRHHRQVQQTVLSRLTFKQNYIIIGGSEKLFCQVLKDVSSRPIITFSDNRISLGTVYQKLGFTSDKIIAPDYFWTGNDEIIKKQTGKKSYFSARGGVGDTEVELANSLGFHQVFDAGKVRWKFDN